jgi:transcription initiation factor TFIIB
MCRSTHRIVDPIRAETHCAECGLVFEDGSILASPPPPPSAATSDGSGRGIGPFVRPGGAKRTLGSTLSLSRDGQGRRLGWRRRYEFQHLRRVMQRQTARAAEGPLERSPARAEILQATHHLGIPDIVGTEAERVFVEAKLQGIFRGRSLSACVGAAVYAACRRFSVPRTLGEVTTAVGGRRAEVGRTFKMIQRNGVVVVPGVGTKAFLTRYAQDLALSPRVRSTVESMLDMTRDDAELSGLSPHGLVAALIYLAAERNGEHRSRAQVARVSAVTEVTLRSTCRLVEKVWADAVPAPGKARTPIS